MVAQPIRIAHLPKALGSCLILLALLMAGFSDAQAVPIVIDTFGEGEQLVPSFPDPPFSSDIATSSAIGGRRFMDANGEAGGGVVDGFSFTLNGDLPGGTIITEWNGGGTLGGVDLTAGGAFFEIDVLLIDGQEVSANHLKLFVTDSSNVQSKVFDVQWETELSRGINLIPFSNPGGADLTSVDIIRLENEALTESTSTWIGSIRVVPEPSTALLLGSALGVLGWARRRTSP